MTYHLTTFGCQMNLSDSERVTAVLAKMNLKPASESQADILIFNLCSVRQAAIDRVWGLLNNVKSQMSNVKCIILTGCILPKDKQKFTSKVNLILNIKDLNSWPEKINKVITNYKLPITNYLRQKNEKNYFLIKPSYASRFSAFVPIMTGCNNFCAYCAVPYTRGREYSRPAEEIMAEVSSLIKRGYKEIILLGQNVNSYQSEISNISLPKISHKKNNHQSSIINLQSSIIDFPSLLRLIDSIPGHYWLSFLTSHPKDMSKELISCFKDCQHLIPYLHLPLQSGSDKILAKMNRRYTAKKYANLISEIRVAFASNSHIPAISTDIIVGFPGETKKDFLATANLMKKIKFDLAYLAEYSPRPGTAAARLKDNVSHQEKTRRRQILNEILKTTALANNQKLVGQTIETLIESVKKTSAFGHTNTMKNVKIITERKIRLAKLKKYIGQVAAVKITNATAWHLAGELISVFPSHL